MKLIKFYLKDLSYDGAKPLLHDRKIHKSNILIIRFKSMNINL